MEAVVQDTHSSDANPPKDTFVTLPATKSEQRTDKEQETSPSGSPIADTNQQLPKDEVVPPDTQLSTDVKDPTPPKEEEKIKETTKDTLELGANQRMLDFESKLREISRTFLTGSKGVSKEDAKKSIQDLTEEPEPDALQTLLVESKNTLIATKPPETPMMSVKKEYVSWIPQQLDLRQELQAKKQALLQDIQMSSEKIRQLSSMQSSLQQKQRPSHIEALLTSSEHHLQELERVQQSTERETAYVHSLHRQRTQLADEMRDVHQKNAQLLASAQHALEEQISKKVLLEQETKALQLELETFLRESEVKLQQCRSKKAEHTEQVAQLERIREEMVQSLDLLKQRLYEEMNAVDLRVKAEQEAREKAERETEELRKEIELTRTTLLKRVKDMEIQLSAQITAREAAEAVRDRLRAELQQKREHAQTELESLEEQHRLEMESTEQVQKEASVLRPELDALRSEVGQQLQSMRSKSLHVVEERQRAERERQTMLRQVQDQRAALDSSMRRAFAEQSTEERAKSAARAEIQRLHYELQRLQQHQQEQEVAAVTIQKHVRGMQARRRAQRKRAEQRRKRRHAPRRPPSHPSPQENVLVGHPQIPVEENLRLELQRVREELEKYKGSDRPLSSRQRYAMQDWSGEAKRLRKAREQLQQQVGQTDANIEQLQGEQAKLLQQTLPKKKFIHGKEPSPARRKGWGPNQSLITGSVQRLDSHPWMSTPLRPSALPSLNVQSRRYGYIQ